MEKKVFWWNKVYTRKELMNDAKWLLLLVGLYYITGGFIMRSRMSLNREILIETVGVMCLIGAFIPMFWVRFTCISVWVIYLLCSILFIEFTFLPILFIAIGCFFLYKMLQDRKY